MIIGNNRLVDLSLDPSESEPQTIPLTTKRPFSFVWLHNTGIMNCGGEGKTACQYWALGASTAASATALPRAFLHGGSVSLGNGAHWIGGGRLASGGGTYEARHYLHTGSAFQRLSPDFPMNLLCFCAIYLGGNRQEKWTRKGKILSLSERITISISLRK